MNKVDFTREAYYWNQHHKRFTKYVTSLPKLLFCQECHGEGGWIEITDSEIGGPWYDCGFCEGTGYVSPWIRGLWLTFKRLEKKRAINDRSFYYCQNAWSKCR